MADELTIRPVTEDEWVTFCRAMQRHFGEDVDEDLPAHLRPLIDLDRTLAVFDGNRIVANYATLTFDLSVPYAAPVPCGGVTVVGVATDHRRRGLLRRMITRGLEDCRDRGEPLAALYASEWPIYWRFGFGLAVPSIKLEISRRSMRLREPRDAGMVRQVDPDEAMSTFPDLYETQRRLRGGTVGRSHAWWERRLLHDVKAWRHGYSERYLALLPGHGYAIYRIKDDWTDNAPDGTLRLDEIVARGPEAYAALWQYLFGVDLVERIVAPYRPPDDPLPFLVVDGMRVKRRTSEGEYLRLVDLPAALTARGYAGRDRLVLEVSDATCPWNTGRWDLDAGPDGATCDRTDDEPDLRLDTAHLAAAFLGGQRTTQLVQAGLVEEARPEAAGRLDRLLAADLLPWNATDF